MIFFTKLMTKLRMIIAKFMTKCAGGDGAATVGCIWLMEILTHPDTGLRLIVFHCQCTTVSLLNMLPQSAWKQALEIAMTALFWLFLHSVSSYRWLHLMDGSPNAGGQPPINSLRPPNIIVSHFLKRRPFDLVSQCTCTLAGPDGSSDLRTIIKTGCCRRWKLSRRPEIIPNKSSSYRRPAQIYRSPLNLPRLNQWFQGSRAKKIGQILCKNPKV